MAIQIPGLAASQALPGVYMSVILGGTGTSAGAAPIKIMLMGNKITSTLTNSAPSFTVTAGTMPNATPTFVASAGDAAILTGEGSELHNMARAVFAQYPEATVWLCSSAESGGARASLVLTFVNAATAAYTIRLVTQGKSYDIAVASGAAIATIAEAVAQAVLDDPTLPFTAQFAAGVVTFTAKHPGTRGNSLILRAYFVDSAGVETRITSSSTTSPGATTGILSGGTPSSEEYLFSGGTNTDDNTAALASMASVRYDRIAAAYIDSGSTSNLTRLVAHMNALATPTEQKWQQGIIGLATDDSTAIGVAQGLNAPRLQAVWHYNNPMQPGVTAAEVAAARLIGDARAGGIRTGEAADPAANLDGMKLVTTPPQYGIADQPTTTEANNALNNSLTVLMPDPDRASGTVIARSVTTRSLANGTPNYAVRDTTNVTVPDYTADYLRADLAVTYAGVKLGSDGLDGRPPVVANVVSPSIVRDRIAFDLAQLEQRGILRDVEANLPLLKVEEDPVVSGRLNCEIPCEPMPGLHIIGGNVRQTA
jgi:phage tail sheath gpL-like